MEWIDGRWHLNGQGIHAGDMLELYTGKKWLMVRIESQNGGRDLYAYLSIDDQEFHTWVSTKYDKLRWPER